MRYAQGLPDLTLIARLDNQPRAIEDRTQVSSAIDPLESTGWLLGIGQSNCFASFHRGSYGRTQAKNHNWNLLNGGTYLAQNPVLGANGWAAGTGDNNSPCVRLGDKLIAAGVWTRVVIAPIGRGGTSTLDWANGICTERMICAALRIRDQGIQPTAVLFHIGEQDAVNGFTAATTAANLRAMVAILRLYGITAPVFIATVSISTSIAIGSAASNATRLGQAQALSSGLGIYAGPDSDAIGDRYDGTHMGATGSDQLATAWTTVLNAYF